MIRSRHDDRNGHSVFALGAATPRDLPSPRIARRVLPAYRWRGETNASLPLRPSCSLPMVPDDLTISLLDAADDAHRCPKDFLLSACTVPHRGDKKVRTVRVAPLSHRARLAPSTSTPSDSGRLPSTNFMHLDARTPRIRCLLHALAAMAAIGAFMPAAVNAGCARNAVSRGGHTDGAAHLSHLVTSGAMDLSDDSETMPPSNSNRPCSGPTCSEDPSDPASPIGSPPLRDPAQWACLFDVAPSSVNAGCFLALARSPVLPSLFGGGVFHPPRRVLA